MWGLSLSDVPLVAWYIGVLVFLEGLLSADNALVLAIMVRHLPTKERRRVLRYGIWGAIGFRFVAVLMSSVLLKFWICKVVGGLYLLYLAISHFLQLDDRDGKLSPVEGGRVPESGAVTRGFWKTVTSITMADIAFSIDSILAAVAMADSFPNRFGPNWKLLIVYVGGVLGIITMRFVVGYFVVLLERFPGLAEGAYFLVAWIGVKLFASGIHDALLGSGIDESILKWFHIPEWLFWSVMLLIAVISLLVKPKSHPPEDRDVKASLDFLDRGSDDLASSGDERLPAFGVDETVRPDQTGAQPKHDEHWERDGRAGAGGEGSLDPPRTASSDQLGESRR
jgi:YkoY family integral membrane protein